MVGGWGDRWKGEWMDSGGKGPGVRWRDAASTRTRSSGTYILGGSYKTEGLKQVEEKWK